MAYVDINELTRWLAEHCALSENEPPRYARIRAGKVRRSAEAIWRKDTGGADPRALAQEISERHGKLGAGERAWLEVLSREGGGQRPIVDTLPLGEAPELDDGERAGGANFDDIESVSPMGLMALSTQSLLSQLQMSETRNRDLQEKLYDVQMKYVEAAANGRADAAMLEYIQATGISESEGYADALREVIPQIPVILAAMQAGTAKKKPTVEGAPEEPAAVLPRLVDELEAHWKAHPDVILADLVNLGRLHTIGAEVGERLKGGA